LKILRTPDDRFRDLPGYGFSPHYFDVADDLRLHYVDEGPSNGTPILMLHGEPSWSFLYRKMIPAFASAGFRAVAPDLIGFGKSDKPADPSDYSYAKHVAWITTWLDAINLRNAILLCQDWGSLIGLRVAMENQDRFAAIVVANGFLPTARQSVPLAFRAWRAFAAFSPVFPIGRIVASGCVSKLSRDIVAAYDAPFPSDAYKAGARIFPKLVPTSENDPAVPANRAAWDALGKWEKPFLTLFGKNDPILGRADGMLQRHVPGSKDQPHERFWGGHFVQEDRGDYLAEQIVRWTKSWSTPGPLSGA
jgi:haloalkane dehalogenase